VSACWLTVSSTLRQAYRRQDLLGAFVLAEPIDSGGSRWSPLGAGLEVAAVHADDVRARLPHQGEHSLRGLPEELWLRQTL
jgi:hypothetical protein